MRSWELGGLTITGRQDSLCGFSWLKCHAKVVKTFLRISSDNLKRFEILCSSLDE